MNAGTENLVVDPSRWDEVGLLLGGGILRPYEELRRMPYYAPPGFYADDTVLAFQPGWDGQDGNDAVHWYAPDWPTIDQVREKIASLLVSSWLVQDRGDAGGFFLGDEPGSLETPWGVIPAHVVFARRKGNDMPWENLASVLADVDAALGAGVDPQDGYVGWRLRNTVPQTYRTYFSRNPLDGGVLARFTPKRDGYVIVFLWDADGRARGGVREEYEDGAVGLYDAIPVPGEEDLGSALQIYA